MLFKSHKEPMFLSFPYSPFCRLKWAYWEEGESALKTSKEKGGLSKNSSVILPKQNW